MLFLHDKWVSRGILAPTHERKDWISLFNYATGTILSGLMRRDLLY